MAKKAATKPAAKKPPAKRQPVEAVPLTDELQIIKPVPEEVISFNAGQVLTGGYLRKRLNLNGEIETYSLAPIQTEPEKRNDAPRPPEPGTTLSNLDGISATSSSPWRRSMLVAGVVAGLGVSFVGGAWSAGGWQVGPRPIVRNDVLQQSYDADRMTQAAVLRDYAAQGFKNDDEGRAAATKWFNDNRFRNRGPDFRPYTSAVTDHFAAGTLAQFADELEGKR